MSKKRHSSFRGKVGYNAQQTKSSNANYGYLRLQGTPIFKEEPGSKNVLLDFLPYEVTDDHHPDKDTEAQVALVGDLWYKRPFKIHRNVGANNETVVCPTSFGKKCPICEYRSKLISEKEDKKTTDALRPSNRILYIVVPLGSKDFDEVPHIWDISKSNFQSLLTDEIDEDPDNEIFPDLEEGLTLKIRFSEESFAGNKFAKASRIDFEDRDQQYDETILKDVPNLDEVLAKLSYKELEALFFGMDEADEAEDDLVEEERPRKKRKPVEEEEEKPKRNFRKRDGDEEEEEEEEVIERPSRRRRAPEPEEEEEEEEQPVRRTRKPAAKAVASGGKGLPKKSGDDEEKCPSGYRFGYDCETEDECDECDL